MVRTTGFCLIALAALHAVPVHAAEDDTQLWLYLNTVVPLEDNLSATFELSPRFREGGDQLLTRASLEHSASDHLSLGGAVAYVEFASGHEFRLHQQAVVSLGPFAFRSRVEERWLAGADRPQIRLRQRLATTVPIAENVKAVVGGEVFYIARPETSGSSARVEQWRAQASLQRKVSPHLDAAVGYLFIYSPRPGTADRISHVPQLTLTFRP
jgi:hypothetical protein